MKTDRELLELAAKAAGIEGRYTERSCSCGKGRDCPLDYWGITTKKGLWNSLANDGDALRLATKLRLRIESTDTYCVAYNRSVCGEQFSERVIDDQNAAMRRAIVRAAAAIGEAA